MFDKNDRKRNSMDVLFHPYNTRSRSSTHPPISIKHRSPKGKGKPEAAAAAAGGLVKKVPYTLYKFIQLAIEARKVWEAKRNKSSKLDLECYENTVGNIATLHKRRKLLPSSWKYNPAIASSYEPKDDIPLPMGTVPAPGIWHKKGSYFDSSNIGNPSTKLHKVNNVPLKENETESWLQFKKLDEEQHPTPVPRPRYEDMALLSTEHPFVSVIGYFAVNGFNESFEMFVEKGNHNCLRDPRFSQCKYERMCGSYMFYMTIDADEDGFRGIYETSVECNIDDGKRTLKELHFTSVKHGKKKRVSKSLKGVLPDIDYTGMYPRSYMSGETYGSYNYTDPSEIVG